MYRYLGSCCLAALFMLELVGVAAAQPDEGWISIFNGKDLSGWKAAEHPETFRVVDGQLVVKGPRAHLFYDGPVQGGAFKNFEWKCEILTKPNSNSGMYIHTAYQAAGWPSKGYEIQVNNTHPDPRKTGGLYAIADVMNQSPVQDDEWFVQHVIVKDKQIIVKVNDKVTVDYTEPDGPAPGQGPVRDQGLEQRYLSAGTIAIQGHDPESEVHFRKIMVKPLP